MKSLVRLVTFVLVIFVVAACGKSEEQKLQDRVQNRNEEHEQLKTYLNSAGTPDASWSDADLNAYEAKLDRLSTIENEMASEPNTYVIGGNNAGVIASKKTAVTMARIEKKRVAQAEDVTSQLDKLNKERNQLTQSLLSNGVPTPDWEKQKLREYVGLCKQINQNNEEQLALIEQNTNRLGYDNASDRRFSINKMKSNISNLQQQAQIYLDQKRLSGRAG
jgi:hypothetical protein